MSARVPGFAAICIGSEFDRQKTVGSFWPYATTISASRWSDPLPLFDAVVVGRSPDIVRRNPTLIPPNLQAAVK